MRPTAEHEQNSRVKEEEYHKVSLDDFRDHMNRKQHQEIMMMSQHDMQKTLDGIYGQRQKTYVLQKKENVKNMKKSHIEEINKLVESYHRLNAMKFLEYYIK